MASERPPTPIPGTSSNSGLGDSVQIIGRCNEICITWFDGYEHPKIQRRLTPDRLDMSSSDEDAEDSIPGPYSYLELGDMCSPTPPISASPKKDKRSRPKKIRRYSFSFPPYRIDMTLPQIIWRNRVHYTLPIIFCNMNAKTTACCKGGNGKENIFYLPSGISVMCMCRYPTPLQLKLTDDTYSSDNKGNRMIAAKSGNVTIWFIHKKEEMITLQMTALVKVLLWNKAKQTDETIPMAVRNYLRTELQLQFCRDCRVLDKYYNLQPVGHQRPLTQDHTEKYIPPPPRPPSAKDKPPTPSRSMFHTAEFISKARTKNQYSPPATPWCPLPDAEPEGNTEEEPEDEPEEEAAHYEDDEDETDEYETDEYETEDSEDDQNRPEPPPSPSSARHKH